MGILCHLANSSKLCVWGCDHIPVYKTSILNCIVLRMSLPTYKELIQLLRVAESLTLDDQHSVSSTAEVLTTRFSGLYPHIKIGRPGRFLETVGRIDGPIRNGRLKGSPQRSYLKRQWAPRTRNTTAQCKGIQ